MSRLGKSSVDRERFAKSDYALEILAHSIAKRATLAQSAGETMTVAYTGGAMKQRIRDAAANHPGNSPEVIALAIEAISTGWRAREFSRAALRSNGWGAEVFKAARHAEELHACNSGTNDLKLVAPNTGV